MRRFLPPRDFCYELPAVCLPLSPKPTQMETRGSKGRDRSQVSGDGGQGEGISEFLQGEERRLAYRLTDLRFTWEGGE